MDLPAHSWRSSATYNAKGMTMIPEDTVRDLPQYGPNIPAAVYTIFGGNKPTGKLPVNIPKLDDSYGFTEEILYPRGRGLSFASESE